MPKRPIPVPDDVAELAAFVVAAKSRGNMGDEDLAKAISYAILADRVRQGATKQRAERPRMSKDQHREKKRILARERYYRLKRDAPDKLREISSRNYMGLRSNPARWRRHTSQQAARLKARRAEDPEFFRARERLYRQRRRERDPEAFALRQREQNRRSREKIPVEVRQAYGRLKSRRTIARRIPEKFIEAATASIPARVPKHIAEDIVQSILASALNGDFCLRDVPKVTAKRVRDFWFAQRRSKTDSLDEASFDGGRRTLHEVVAG